MFDGVFVRLRWLRWQCVAGRGREQVLGLALPNINFQPQILIQCSGDEGEGFIDASSPAQQGNGNLVRGR